jgi:hypothetical protein
MVGVSYHGLKAVAFPHSGFPATDLRQTGAGYTSAFGPRRLFYVLGRTLSGLYPERRWPIEGHARSTTDRPADSHRGNSR